jgi:hypothetical protein
MFPLARIYPSKFIKVWNFARDVYRQIGRIKARDSFYPGFSRQNSLAESRLTHAIGADDA